MASVEATSSYALNSRASASAQTRNLHRRILLRVDDVIRSGHQGRGAIQITREIP
jgi:hypothetical protein